MASPTDTPILSVMLIVSDAATAVDWYKSALGAHELWNLGSGRPSSRGRPVLRPRGGTGQNDRAESHGRWTDHHAHRSLRRSTRATHRSGSRRGGHGRSGSRRSRSPLGDSLPGGFHRSLRTSVVGGRPVTAGNARTIRPPRPAIGHPIETIGCRCRRTRRVRGGVVAVGVARRYTREHMP